MSKKSNFLWDGIEESDFINELDITPVELWEYNLENMVQYAMNTNIWRHIIRLSDSLKPVMRRVLYASYLEKAYDGKHKKSTVIQGKTMEFHGHGDGAIYAACIGMSQPWKMQCPILDIDGNFGSSSRPEMYAHARYTDSLISPYAKECFFEDYDPDCVEMVFNSASDKYEPMSLPSKFPNILINGGMGIAFGNAFRIPTYNIDDIIRVCINVINEPDTADVFMVPDLPSGCEVVDDGTTFREIINTGKGTLKMRASATIHDRGKSWAIEFNSLPWMVSLTKIDYVIRELAKSGKLPIKDTSDNSQALKSNKNGSPFMVSYSVIIDKSQDPRTLLEKLYTLTDLQKTVSVDFKVVLDSLEVSRLNMRELINSWIDERRSYKRRYFNKKLNKISARLELLKIILHLLKKDNIEKTITILKNSSSSEVINRLMKHGNMNSYQASKIAEMRFNQFTTDAKARYIEEQAKLKIDYEELLKLIVSEDRIDAIIVEELMDLKKYARPRASKIVKENTTKYVSDTMHTIITTKDGLMKKLLINPQKPTSEYSMGAFKTNDYPTLYRAIHNTRNIMFFDTFGRYTIMPVSDIDSHEASTYGQRAFDVTKLNGKIITMDEAYDEDIVKSIVKVTNEEPYLVMVTGKGYAKRTSMNEFLEMKNSRNIRAMKIRDDDSLVAARILHPSVTVIIYSKQGKYCVMKVADIAEQGKTSMGLITMRLTEDDYIAGISVIGELDDHIALITEKGVMKRIELKYIGNPVKRSAVRMNTTLLTLDNGDTIHSVIGTTEYQTMQVVIRNKLIEIPCKDIPELSKKAKGRRLVSSGPGNNIVVVRAVD